jgi:hypothetical protein
VDQSPDLRRECLHQARMIVAQGIDGDSAEGIKVGLALLVDQATAIAMGEGDRQPPVGVHQMRHESTPPKAPTQKHTAAEEQRGRRAWKRPYTK